MTAIVVARSARHWWVATALMAACTGAVQAQDIYWSLGMSSPGVQLGVSNAPPVMMYPQPVIVQRPVMVAPQVVYVQNMPMVAPPVTYYSPWPPGQAWGHRHGRHHGFNHERD